jgi:hypothetical protein
MFHDGFSLNEYNEMQGQQNINQEVLLVMEG